MSHVARQLEPLTSIVDSDLVALATSSRRPPLSLSHSLSSSLGSSSASWSASTMTPAEQLARVKEALGCIIIGLIMSSILYGITVLQTYIYYKENRRDLVRVKVLVGIVFFFDTAASASITAGAFIFFVNDFGRQGTLMNTPPSLALETGANALIATLTQFFFAYRLYIVSRKNKILVSIILILAVLSLGPAAWTAAFFLGASSLFNLGLPKVRAIASLATGLPAICDILIAWGLCYYLHTSRSGFKKSDTVIDRLMLYTIECGALTAVCQTCILVTFAALPGRIIFIPFQLVVGKLYCNALLASLNVRWRIRELNSIATRDAATRADTGDQLGSQRRRTRTGDKDKAKSREKDSDSDVDRTPESESDPAPTVAVSFGGAASTSTTAGTSVRPVPFPLPPSPFPKIPLCVPVPIASQGGSPVACRQTSYSPDALRNCNHGSTEIYGSTSAPEERRSGSRNLDDESCSIGIGVEGRGVADDGMM